MNSASLVGNVTKNPEIYTTQGGIKRANFTLAVQRRFANAQGVREADFIPIVCWRQLADTIDQFVHKGMKLGVEGVIQVRQYETQDGQKRSVTEIVADTVEFLSPSLKAEPRDEKPEPQHVEASQLTEEPDDELPF